MKKINEEGVPANNVGGGSIAGAGVGPDGEPGVHRKRKKLSPIQATMLKRWIKGRM